MKHILIYAPTPPPYAGPEVATSLLLDAVKGEKIKLTHVRSNVRQENGKKGVFDLEGIFSFIRVYRDFWRALLQMGLTKSIFPISMNKPGTRHSLELSCGQSAKRGCKRR